MEATIIYGDICFEIQTLKHRVAGRASSSFRILRQTVPEG